MAIRMPSKVCEPICNDMQNTLLRLRFTVMYCRYKKYRLHTLNRSYTGLYLTWVKLKLLSSDSHERKPILSVVPSELDKLKLEVM